MIDLLDLIILTEYKLRKEKKDFETYFKEYALKISTWINQHPVTTKKILENKIDKVTKYKYKLKGIRL